MSKVLDKGQGNKSPMIVINYLDQLVKGTIGSSFSSSSGEFLIS